MRGGLPWLPFLLAMLKSRAVRELLRDLWQLTGGNVAAATKAVRRMRDQGVVLEEGEADIDVELAELEQRQKDGQGPGGAA